MEEPGYSSSLTTLLTQNQVLRPDNSDGFPVWAGILVGLLVGIIIGFVGAKLFSKLRGSKANKSQGDYERLTKERNDIIKDSLKD
jgi:uncharacterized membrane-anchored protein YhcB (DUF1043 family)